MLPWNSNNSLLGHLSGIAFCLFIKLKKPQVCRLLEGSARDHLCLRWKAFVTSKTPSWLKNFRLQRSIHFFYLQWISTYYQSPKKNSLQLVNKLFTRSLLGKRYGGYLYLLLNQILQSFVLRNTSVVFYAEGKERTEFVCQVLGPKSWKPLSR